MENSGLFFPISWKQDSWIIDPLSALGKPEEFLPQTSRDFWSGLGKMAYLIFIVSHWLEFMPNHLNVSSLCTSCGRMAKQMSIWGRRKPFSTDVLHPGFIPLSFCTSWCQWGALQGSNTWHNVMVSWNFGPQHCSPTLTALPTWILLNSWRIKSQGCQLSLWGIELPQLVWPFSSATWKGQDFHISSRFLSWWDLFMILMSRSYFPAWWPAELTCMSQAQQIWWAYCLLHVLCKRMKHYYLNNVCSFALSIPACLNCC